MKLTRELARAAATDAANRAMRAGGRAAWSYEDTLVAIREFNRLCPLDSENALVLAERLRKD